MERRLYEANQLTREQSKNCFARETVHIWVSRCFTAVDLPNVLSRRCCQCRDTRINLRLLTANLLAQQLSLAVLLSLLRWTTLQGKVNNTRRQQQCCCIDTTSSVFPSVSISRLLIVSDLITRHPQRWRIQYSLLGRIVSTTWSVTIVNRAKTAEPIEMSFGMWTRLGPGNHVLDGGCTLAPPGEYDWTVRVRGRCGLMSNKKYVLWNVVYLSHSRVHYNRHCHLFFMSPLLSYLDARNCLISTAIP